MTSHAGEFQVADRYRRTEDAIEHVLRWLSERDRSRRQDLHAGDDVAGESDPKPEPRGEIREPRPDGDREPVESQAVPVRGDPRRPVPGRGVLQVLEVPDLRGQIRTQVWTK